jgi:hypothetical protein
LPNSPFLAPERDSAFKRGRAKRADATILYWQMPGALESNTTWSVSANVDYYQPIFVDTPLVVDRLAVEVTTSVGTNFRIGMYAADTDWQPVGAPVADSGDIAVATPAVKTYTPGTPLFLPRGRYLGVLNADGAATFRVGQGNGPATMHLTTLGGSMPETYKVARTYAAFPTPGTAWTGNDSSSYGLRSFLWLRITGP